MYVLCILLVCGLAGCSQSADPDTSVPAVESAPVSPVSDFEYTVSEQAGAVSIDKYLGTNTMASIPDEIEDKPVTFINTSTFAESRIQEVYTSPTR